MTSKPNAPKMPRGRPEKPTPKLGVSPTRAARAIFSAVKPPDPKRRIPKRKAALAS